MGSAVVSFLVLLGMVLVFDAYIIYLVLVMFGGVLYPFYHLALGINITFLNTRY